jgi:hypothetical protein
MALAIYGGLLILGRGLSDGILMQNAVFAAPPPKRPFYGLGGQAADAASKFA